MNPDELRLLLTDYLDGLLEDEGVAEAERWIARDPKLFADVARLRARLYQPYDVPPPRPGLEERILARFRERPRQRLARYAAAFAAGVLLTLFLDRAGPAPVLEAPSEEEAPPAALLVQNRVLR